MKFSIIVPVYNTKEYLCQCIDSLLAQTYGNFEIIIVDDGSTDGSSAFCDTFYELDSRISVYHKENGGLVSARKFGAERCSGDYVLNVDSDDYVQNNLLQKMYELIGDFDTECVVFGMRMFYENGNEEIRVNGMEDGLYKVIDLKDNWLYDSSKKNINYGVFFYGVCLKAVKRECYLKAQMMVPEDITTGEDVIFTANLMTLVKYVYIINEPLYNYRILNSSMVRSIDSRSYTNLNRVIFELINLIGDLDSIVYYSFHRVWNMLELEARNASSYKGFKSKIDNNNVVKYINKFNRIQFWDFKSKIKLILLRHKMWFFVYLLSKKETK